MLLYVMNSPPSPTDSNGSNDTEIVAYDSPKSIRIDATVGVFHSPDIVNNSTDIPCSNCSKRCSGKCPGCCLTEQAFYSDNKRTMRNK